MTIKTSIGNITASKAMLNSISLAFRYSSRYHEEKNNIALSEHELKISDEIYTSLEEKGYYD